MIIHYDIASINDHLSADHVKDTAGGADNDVLTNIQLPHVLPVDQGGHSLTCILERSS